MTGQITVAQAWHAEAIAANCRPADVQELWATAFATPLHTMLRGMRWSSFASTGLIDGVPVCMYGVTPRSLLSDIGTPWMVGSAALDDPAVASLFLRHCKDETGRMLQLFPRLENHIDARNRLAIRWLTWLGFTLHRPEPYGVLGLPFHKFTMGGA